MSAPRQSADPDVGEPTLLGDDAGGSVGAETPAVETRPRSDWKPLPVGIGRFAILRELGSGGMGHVYVGRDEGLQRDVAIKVVRDERLSARNHARLRREAQALAQLAHPNVVPVFEVGEHEGQTYLAMELVVGVSIRRWLRHEPRSWQDILAVFVQAGRGLAAAHARGLVHRDFKPENALVGDDPDGVHAVGRVRVVDFGLVVDDEGSSSEHDVVAAPTDDMLRTQTHEVLGTPGYMAPEQLQRGLIGAAADQFALCVSLFEALTRMRPFAGNSAQEIATSVLTGTPLPLPEGPWPAALGEVLQRGMAHDPAARFPSMTALVDALAAVVDTQPRSRRRPVLLAALAGAAIAIGVAVWLWPRARPSVDELDPPAQPEPARMSEPPRAELAPPAAAAQLHGPPSEEQTQASEPYAQAVAAEARGEHDHAARLFGKAASFYERSGGWGEDLAHIELERALAHRGAYLLAGEAYDLIVAFELLVRSSYNHYGHPRPREVIIPAVEAMHQLRAAPQRATPAGVMLDLSARYHLLFVDQHPPGTEVVGLEGTICREPCTLPTRMGEGAVVRYRRDGFHEGLMMLNPPGLDWTVTRMPLVRLAPGEVATPIELPH